MIFFVFQGNAGLSTQDWIDLRNSIDPNRNTLWIAEGLSGCCLYGGAMDGMYAFNISWANGSAGRYQSERSAVLNNGGSLYIPMVHPGWDETKVAQRDNRPNPSPVKDRAGGQFLANSFNGAVASGANVIMIGTWNEYVENSHIEPSNVYGTQALDTLRPLIAAWEGQSPAPQSDSASTGGVPAGATVTARTVLNVRTRPVSMPKHRKAAQAAVTESSRRKVPGTRSTSMGSRLMCPQRIDVSGVGCRYGQNFPPGTQVVEANTRINVRSAPKRPRHHR